MKTPELLPCPFCGGQARLMYVSRIISDLLLYIACQKCGCKGNWFTRENTKDWEKQSIDSWNKRVNSHEGLIEALMRIRKHICVPANAPIDLQFMQDVAKEALESAGMTV